MKIRKVSLLLAFATLPSASYAVNFNWNGGTGDWSDGTQWTPGGPPGGGGGNHAFISAGVANITSNTNAMQDTFVRGTGTVNQTAGTHSNASWHFIGDQSGNNATYSLSGGTAQTNRWYLGRAGGTGTVNVSSAGNLVSTGSDGGNVALIMGDGAGSKGFLNVTGGTSNFNGEGWIGQGAGGYGEVNHSSGTVNVSNWLAIGRQGATGLYKLSGDAILNKTGANHVVLGSLGGKGTIDQTGGTMNVNNDFRLGENAGGEGTLNLSAGSANVTGWTVIGWTGTGKGVVNVSGTGTLNSGYVEVGGGAGGSGDGTLNMNGGTVWADRISKGGGATGVAQVNFNGGTFKAKANNGDFITGFTAANTEIQAGGLKVDTNGFDLATGLALDGAGGLTKLNAGRLTLSGATTYAGTSTVDGGTLQVDGSTTGSVVTNTGAVLAGIGSVGGNVTVTGGTLSPGQNGGADAGTLSVLGSVTLNSASTLMLTINDDAPGGFDVINNTGSFSAGGAMLTGTFSDTTFNMALDAASLATATRYKFVTGAVDGTTFGNATPISAADLAVLGLSSGDEVTIGGQRFLLEKGSWALVPIPEPSAALLALTGLALLRRRRA